MFTKMVVLQLLMCLHSFDRSLLPVCPCPALLLRRSPNMMFAYVYTCHTCGNTPLSLAFLLAVFAFSARKLSTALRNVDSDANVCISTCMFQSFIAHDICIALVKPLHFQCERCQFFAVCSPLSRNKCNQESLQLRDSRCTSVSRQSFPTVSVHFPTL